jgi:hypothetical protein
MDGLGQAMTEDQVEQYIGRDKPTQGGESFFTDSL